MRVQEVVWMFADRAEAGSRLAAILKERELPADTLVLGVPRGGVIVAAEVARALGLELDVEVVRKIGAPGDPEYAIGAVDAEGHVIGEPGGWATEAYIREASEQGREEIARRLEAYRGSEAAADVAGRAVLLVDDGIATGLTLPAAVRSLRLRGARSIIVAAPVSSATAERDLRGVADDVIVAWVDPAFQAVGQYYRYFDQTSDAEVVTALRAVWGQRERDTTE